MGGVATNAGKGGVCACAVEALPSPASASLYSSVCLLSWHLHLFSSKPWVLHFPTPGVGYWEGRCSLGCPGWGLRVNSLAVMGTVLQHLLPHGTHIFFSMDVLISDCFFMTWAREGWGIWVAPKVRCFGWGLGALDPPLI